jgi:hypothetical protein
VSVVDGAPRVPLVLVQANSNWLVASSSTVTLKVTV